MVEICVFCPFAIDAACRFCTVLFFIFMRFSALRASFSFFTIASKVTIMGLTSITPNVWWSDKHWAVLKAKSEAGIRVSPFWKQPEQIGSNFQGGPQLLRISAFL